MLSHTNLFGFFFPLSLGFHFDGSKTKKTKKTLARLDYMQGFQNHFYIFFCTLVKWTHCLYCKGITKVLVLLVGQIIRYTCISYKSWSVLPWDARGREPEIRALYDGTGLTWLEGAHLGKWRAILQKGKKNQRTQLVFLPVPVEVYCQTKHQTEN